MKERSPFTPGHPVPPEYFVGRQKQIEMLQRAISQVAQGKNENIFLTGERGIGKSSLASLCKTFAVEKHQLAGTHCYLGAIKGVPDLCRTILQGLLDENPETSFLGKAKALLGRYIEELRVELPFVGPAIRVVLKEPTKLEDLPVNFLSIFRNLYQTIKGERKGFAIILDDLNGATKVPGVANFLKSFIDGLAGSVPLLFCLVGVEERRSDLISEQQSVDRIFSIVELGPMDDEECREFYRKTFATIGISVNDDALSLMVKYSGGIPTLLHEIGEATFYTDIVDNRIDHQNAIDGIKNASISAGRKYIDRKVFEEIRSDARRQLLLKITKSLKSLASPVIRKDVLQLLTDKEKKDFDNLLRRMDSLGILKKGIKRGEYVFQNGLFPVYIRMFLAEKIEKGGKPKV